MTEIYQHRLQWFAKSPALLQSLSTLQRGIEKESLRVDTQSGKLALSLHPESLGSALTHPKITTDYSEALLEFITPVCGSISEALQQLTDIHHFTYHKLAQQQEILWTNSMPCLLGKPDDIPVALYGNSNVGKMKTIYRVGLGHRYGRAMQTISGIHYNFSLADKFWAKYQQLQQNQQTLSQFKTEQYFGLMRNFRRYVPLFVYLFGASPAISKSFLQGQAHQLDTLGDHTLYGEYATSLRMGDLGYQSNAQNALFVCYNSLERYIETLRKGIVEPHADYQAIGLKDAQGQYKQLNTSLLQIENEFYSTIRPKRVTASGESPINALKRGGVEYIEVRCVDLDPFAPVGIASTTMRFLDIFLLYCLLQDSPLLLPDACMEANTNLRTIVNQGRKPDVQLSVNGQPVAFADWAKQLLQAMQPIAALLDKLNASGRYQLALDLQQAKLTDINLTPSAQVLRTMQQEQLSFSQFALKQSQHWQQYFLEKPLDPEVFDYFTEQAADSLVQQQSIESADTLSFDDYLANFYQQYKA